MTEDDNLLLLLLSFSQGFPSDDRTDETDNEEDEDEDGKEAMGSKIYNITANLKEKWNEKLDAIKDKWEQFKEGVSSRRRRDLPMEDAEDDSRIMAFEKILRELEMIRETGITSLEDSLTEAFPAALEHYQDESEEIAEYRMKRSLPEDRPKRDADSVVSALDSEIRSLRDNMKKAAVGLGIVLKNRQQRDLAPLVGGLNSTVHGLLSDLGGVVAGLGDILKGRKRRYLSSLISGVNGTVHEFEEDLGESVKGLGDILSGRKKRWVSIESSKQRNVRELNDRTASLIKQITNIDTRKEKREIVLSKMRKIRQSGNRGMQKSSSSESSLEQESQESNNNRMVTMSTKPNTTMMTTTMSSTSTTTGTTTPTTTFPPGRFAMQTARPNGMMMQGIMGNNEDGEATISAEEPTIHGAKLKAMLKPKFNVKPTPKKQSDESGSSEEASSEMKNSTEATSPNSTLSTSLRKKAQDSAETTSKSSKHRRQSNYDEWLDSEEDQTTPIEDSTKAETMAKREAQKSLKDWLLNGHPFSGFLF